MKSDVLYCGVDVSKSTLDLIGINQRGDVVLSHRVIDNNTKAIKAFFKDYSQVEGFFVAFENTGVYSYQLALTLVDLGIPYYQLSAFAVNRSKGLQRGKSDRSDALVIARYLMANRYKLSESKLADDVYLELSLLQTQREKIINAIKQFGSNKERYEQLPKRLQNELRRTDSSILKNLNKNLEILENRIAEIIKSDEELNTNYQLVQSVPGVGPQTALYLLIKSRGFNAFGNARKLACYAGVAPFPYQSGTSIKGRTKVHPMADKKLKSLIHMCALTAKKYDHELKEYYERKVEEGKNKMLVLNNIRNKLLQRIFAVVNRQQPYVNVRKYAA